MGIYLAGAHAAGGPLDGIYSCYVGINGYTSQAFVTVNGQPNGSSIFAVAAVTASAQFYGYGIGNATTTIFSGNTMFNLPFSLSVNSTTHAMSGSIGIDVYGHSVTASANCSKIF